MDISIRIGKIVAAAGYDGAWRVLAHGDSSALIEHVWRGERLRIPLDLLELA